MQVAGIGQGEKRGKSGGKAESRKQKVAEKNGGGKLVASPPVDNPAFYLRGRFLRRYKSAAGKP